MTINSDQLTIEKLKKQNKELQAVVDRVGKLKHRTVTLGELKSAIEYAQQHVTNNDNHRYGV